MADHAPIIIKKKKVHGGHGHHGGSWKVAYADFVTAMMAFFMVMWIMGLSDDDKAQIQGYFNDPMGFNKTLPRSKQVISIPGVPAMRPGTSREPDGERFAKDHNALQKMVGQLKRALSETGLQKLLKQVEISMTREGLRIEFIESSHVAFFETGSAVLKPEGRRMVSKIAPLLARSGREMMVEGHTDARPYGGNAYTNWDLSSDRAQALRRALSEGGVKLDQYRAVRGLADTELRDASDPLSASNRRVSILLPWRDEKSPPDAKGDAHSELAPAAPGIRPEYQPPAGALASEGHH
jgi:chemotaxis protein MotB